MWRMIICHGVGCFQSAIFFLTLPKWIFTFGVYQRWICLHAKVPLNVSIITPWKYYYLLGPWG